MVTTYYNESADVCSALDAMEQIDEEMEELNNRGELNDEKLSKLYYQKFIQGLKLNTGYVKL
jgi:hypothetical protein